MASFSSSVGGTRTRRPRRAGQAPQRGVAGRRGVGQNFNKSLSQSDIQSTLSSIQNFLDSASRVPNEPTDEINEARNWIDTLESFASSLSSLQGELGSILGGRYPAGVKQEAQGLYSEANNLLASIDDEIQRAQSFINTYEGRDERVGQTLSTPSQPNLQALSV